MGVYTVRDVDETTKRAIANYAQAQGLNIGEALRQLVFFATSHLQRKKPEKKYSSLMDLYAEIHFKGGKTLARDHDKVAYGL